MFGRHSHRLSTGLIAVTGLLLVAVAAVRIVGAVLRRVARAASPLARRYLGWYWRLPIVAKIVVTAGEIILLQLLMPFAPIRPFERHELVDAAAIGLVGLLLIGILFGATGSRAR
jgi:sorbitol-specific phosphotransferase system component IIC